MSWSLGGIPKSSELRKNASRAIWLLVNKYGKTPEEIAERTGLDVKSIKGSIASKRYWDASRLGGDFSEEACWELIEDARSIYEKKYRGRREGERLQHGAELEARLMRALNMPEAEGSGGEGGDVEPSMLGEAEGEAGGRVEVIVGTGLERRVTLAPVVFLLYDWARNKGFGGDLGSFLTQCVIGYFRDRGLIPAILDTHRHEIDTPRHA